MGFWRAVSEEDTICGLGSSLLIFPIKTHDMLPCLLEIKKIT